MRTTLFGKLKFLAGASLCIGTSAYGFYANDQFEKKLKTLPPEKLAAMRKRDEVLENNCFYNSESPYLRAIAVADYNHRTALQKKL